MAIATEPTKWIRPLGESADVNAIADEYKGENSISFKELFPPITQLPLSAGGVCPDRKDTNALYKLLGDYVWYAQHGGIPTYSENFDYHVGAFVEYEGKTYICIVANGAGTVVKTPTDTSAWSQIMSLADVGNQFVSLSDSQTVAGVKVFSSVTKSATPSASASGTEVVTAAWTRSYTENKWQDVATEHNNIYRGANLLNGHFSSISDVISAISKGDFSDIYVGDYIPASYTVDSSTVSTNFRIAGINTLKSRGGTWGTQNPNVCIVPDQLGTSCMNDSNTTAGGYVGSKMYTTILPKYYKALAGSASCPFYGHILTTTERLTNSVDTSKTCESYSGNYGVANGAADYANQNLILMSEVEVYGCKHWSSCERDDESMCVQLPLFRLKPEIITLNSTCWFWLRSVAGSAIFCYSGNILDAGCYGASIVFGVRPRFFIG